jgi:hypothetical protein
VDPQTLFQNTVADGYSPATKDVDEFAVVPETDGLTDFGSISEELSEVTGLRPLPIRLLNGKHFGSGGGYGIAHLLHHHGPAIALHDYFSVQDFVLSIARDFDATYEGDRDRVLILRRNDGNPAVDRLLVLELSDCETYWSAVSGWFVSSRRPVRGKHLAERVKNGNDLVWECRAPHSSGPG